MKNIYPWLEPIYQRLDQSYNQQQMHHALMFTGIQGLGRFDLCLLLAQVLLCSSAKPPRPCGQCSGCKMFGGGSHPDLSMLGEDAAANVITIDQVRSVITGLQQTAHQGFNRVIIVREAHRMNKSAANALLKNLEEPPADTYFLLTSSRFYRLPATIRSRVQMEFVAVPEMGKAISWLSQECTMPKNQAEQLLAQAHGAPLLARDYQQGHSDGMRRSLQVVVDHFRHGTGSMATVLTALEQYTPRDVFLLLDDWLCEIVRYSLTGDGISAANIDRADWLIGMCRNVDCRAVYRLRDRIWRSIELLESQINPNLPLLFIDGFMGLTSLWSKRVATA